MTKSRTAPRRTAATPSDFHFNALTAPTRDLVKAYDNMRSMADAAERTRTGIADGTVTEQEGYAYLAGLIDGMLEHFPKAEN